MTFNREPLYKKERIVDHYSDTAILGRVVSSKGLGLLLHRKFLMFVVYWISSTLKIMIAGMAHIGAVLFRYRFGELTMGFILMTVSVGLMVLINYNGMAVYFKPLVFLILVGLLVFKLEKVPGWVTEDIHSPALLGFIAFYALLSLIHLIMIYLGKGAIHDTTKRGSSYLHRYVLAKAGVSEYTVQVLIEPLLLALAGLIAWSLRDPTLALVLWISAACIIFQQLRDHGHQLKVKPPQ